MNHLDVFSDGAASQFKIKYIFCFLSMALLEMFKEIKLVWHFFATSHGKGAVDDVGGTVKQVVSNTLQAAVVNYANTFATVAAVTSIAINMMLVTAADIGTFTQQHNLEEVPIIPGTQSRHYIEPFMLGKIQHKTYSASKKSSIHTFLHRRDEGESEKSFTAVQNPQLTSLTPPRN